MSISKSISNPYSPVGDLHNKGLDYILANLDPSQPVTIELILRYSSEYLQSLVGSSLSIDYANNYDSIATTVNSVKQIPFDDILRNGKITNKDAIHFINDIRNVSDEFDYPTVLEILKNIEENILASDMDEADKQYPLLSVAVAISSVSYWVTQLNDPASRWRQFEPDISARKWPWSSDANGAIGGGIGGAIGGLAGGLGGVLIGGLLGAIGGAIGASVADFFVP